MRSFGPVALAAVVASVAIVSPADAADPKQEAKKLIAKGDALFRKGDYEGALAQYQRAYAAFQSPKIFFPMAQAEEKLGRDLEALAHYEQLLSDAGEDLSESVKAETQTHIQEIEKRIAVVSFDVYPVGATISIDDVEIGLAPLEKSTRLMPGAHKYTFAAGGYKAQEHNVELVPGDRPTVNVKLKSSQSMVSTKPKPKAERKQQEVSATDDGGGGQGTLYAGITFTAAFGVAATVTGLLAVSQHGIFTDPTKTADEREAARDSGASLATVTDLLVIGTAAAGVFTIYWYYSHKGTTRRDHRAKPAQSPPDDGAAPPVPGGEDDDAPPGMGASLLVTPYASEGGGGLVVMGRF